MDKENQSGKSSCLFQILSKQIKTRIMRPEITFRNSFENGALCNEWQEKPVIL